MHHTSLNVNSEKLDFICSDLCTNTTRSRDHTSAKIIIKTRLKCSKRRTCSANLNVYTSVLRNLGPGFKTLIAIVQMR